MQGKRSAHKHHVTFFKAPIKISEHNLELNK